MAVSVEIWKMLTLCLSVDKLIERTTGQILMSESSFDRKYLEHETFLQFFSSKIDILIFIDKYIDF